MRVPRAVSAGYRGVLLLLAHAGLAALAEAATPESLRVMGIDGLVFPLSEAVLAQEAAAMAKGDATARMQVYRHAWGLWTALTRETGQVEGRQRLRVFETWESVDDLAAPDTANAGTPSADRRATRRIRALRMRADDEGPTELPISFGPPLLGAVRFDPVAAQHVRDQQLLDRASLLALLNAGAIGVTPFPSSAVVVKPIYLIARQRDLQEGRFYDLPVWDGPPAVAQAYGPDRWTTTVRVGVTDRDAGSGDVFPIGAFIHHTLSAAEAAGLNASQPDLGAGPGDTALLVAMHVTGRELARWTWQTFWWTPDPSRPPAPSSPEIAASRPAQLVGAPAHYAMAVAYALSSPDQPYTGGDNSAPAVYAYNPWVEARLGPSDLPDSLIGVAPDGTGASNNTGVQSNCMSCHARAAFNPSRLATAPRFAAARYVDLGDAAFVGTLQTDFLWSLARHAR